MNPGDRGRFAAELIRRVNAHCRRLALGESPLPAYRARSFVTGRDIVVIGPDGRGRPAVAGDITDDGGLNVRYADGSAETLRSGEISLKIVQSGDPEPK
jgi:biotin-(acetyl-CoA carboxylase) ligase